MKWYCIIVAIVLVGLSPLFSQETGSQDDPQELLLSEIADNIDQYRGRSLQLVLRLQHVYYDYRTISFYDEENINIQFDITGYTSNPLYVKSLNHTDRGRQYVVFCTIEDVDADGDIIATLQEYRPLTLYSLPY